MRRYCRRCRQPLAQHQSLTYPSFCTDACHDVYQQRRRAQRDAIRHGATVAPRNIVERRALARLSALRGLPPDNVPSA